MRQKESCGSWCIKRSGGDSSILVSPLPITMENRRTEMSHERAGQDAGSAPSVPGESAMRRLAVVSAILFVSLAAACAGARPGPSPQYKDTMDVQAFVAGRHDGNATFQMKCRLSQDYG